MIIRSKYITWSRGDYKLPEALRELSTKERMISICDEVACYNNNKKLDRTKRSALDCVLWTPQDPSPQGDWDTRQAFVGCDKANLIIIRGCETMEMPEVPQLVGVNTECSEELRADVKYYPQGWYEHQKRSVHGLRTAKVNLVPLLAFRHCYPSRSIVAPGACRLKARPQATYTFYAEDKDGNLHFFDGCRIGLMIRTLTYWTYHWNERKPIVFMAIDGKEKSLIVDIASRSGKWLMRHKIMSFIPNKEMPYLMDKDVENHYLVDIMKDWGGSYQSQKEVNKKQLPSEK